MSCQTYSRFFVGGAPELRLPVIAASPAARAAGVLPGQPLRQAQQLCPAAAFVAHDPAAVTGLRAALAELNLSPTTVVGIGDAENDHVFLRICGVSAAVANALPALKKEVDFVSRATHGAGVEELVGKILCETPVVGERAPCLRAPLG